MKESVAVAVRQKVSQTLTIHEGDVVRQQAMSGVTLEAFTVCIVSTVRHCKAQ